MKKYKLLGLLLAVITFLAMPIAYAHEIDITNKVEFTVSDSSEMWSKNQILIPDTWKNPEISYQYVEISKEVFQNYLSLSLEASKYAEENVPSESATAEEKKEYDDTIREYEASKEALLPAYVEANWKVTEDHTTPLDTTKYTGETHFVLWVKVTYTEDGTSKVAYNDLVVTYISNATSGEQDEEKDVPNAKTGDNIVLFAVGAALVAGVMVISYRKVNA